MEHVTSKSIPDSYIPWIKDLILGHVLIRHGASYQFAVIDPVAISSIIILITIIRTSFGFLLSNPCLLKHGL